MNASHRSDDSVLCLPIPDATVLWRRVPAEKKVFDENLKRWRPTSDSFSDNPRNGTSMSVYDAGNSGGIEAVMAGHDGFLLCRFTAGYVRSLGLEIVRTAQGGVGHCEVVGNKSKSIKSAIAKNVQWEIGPQVP